MATLGLGGPCNGFFPPPPPLDLSLALNSGMIDLSSALVGPPPALPSIPPLDLSAALVTRKIVEDPAKENIETKPKRVLKTYDAGLGQFKTKTEVLLGSSFNFRTNKSSALGAIICRKWARRSGLPFYKDPFPIPKTVPHFRFNCPSPDDKVLRALNKNVRK